MDLGGVMLEWNPDHLLTRFQPEPKGLELRQSIGFLINAACSQI